LSDFGVTLARLICVEASPSPHSWLSLLICRGRPCGSHRLLCRALGKWQTSGSISDFSGNDGSGLEHSFLDCNLSGHPSTPDASDVVVGSFSFVFRSSLARDTDHFHPRYDSAFDWDAARSLSQYSYAG